LKEITTESTISRRLVLNEVQTTPSSTPDQTIPIKPIQSTDLSTNGKLSYVYLYLHNPC
jgi:hypothetical protein